MSVTQLGLKKICTTLSHLSTPFMATFLLVHLSAPLAATLGGSELASQVMLFGREYYQARFIEPWLVFAPLGLHVFSGVVKRITYMANPSPQGPNRRLGISINLLATTAYPLIIFLTIHVLSHRLIPSTPESPIHALSPSELDYDFVKTGIQTWPFRSIFLYGGLLICAAVHTLEGTNVILRTWFPRIKPLSLSMKYIISETFVSYLLVGLARISREPAPVLLKATSDRILASFRSLWIYRI